MRPAAARSSSRLLTEVIPVLGVLPLAERQAARKGSLAASAIAIHGYIRLAHRFYPDGDLTLLERLAGKVETEDGDMRGRILMSVNRSARCQCAGQGEPAA